MTALRTAVWVAIALVLVVVGSWSGPTAHGPPTLGVGAPGTGTPATVAPARASSAVAASAASREQRLLDDLEHSGVPSTDIHFPNFAAMLEPHSGIVSPTYSVSPAPMGVSDLGIRNVSGTLEPYLLTTSSVRGTIQFTNALSAYVDGDGPDMFGVQLNSVDTGVTVFGNDSGQFWTQNFVSYTPSSGELSFGDNIWNFSNPSGLMSANVFYETGPNGTLYAPVFYYAIGPTFTIHYPFTISFYNNATVLDDRPAVYFNYTLSNSTMSESGSFDYVIFNATVGAPTASAPSGEFQVDGYGVDPIGLPNDIELDVVGNDDGDTTTFYAMEANLTISGWNTSTRSYQPLPSAYDAGAETGETSDGVFVCFDAGSSVAHMVLGPSFLTGLWNVSSASGAVKVTYTATPTNSFTFVSTGSTTVLDPATAQWVPTFGGSPTLFYLPNAQSFAIDAMLSDYAPDLVGASPSANSSVDVSVSLTPDTAVGVYTPLFADGNAQLAAISSAGTGASANPYRIDNNEYGGLDPLFATWNDYQFPVFPGLLLIDTTDYVTVTPPSFEITYPSWQFEDIYSVGLPGSNDLQLEFWNVSNVVVLNGSVSGWLSFELDAYPLGSVIFWNSTGNLVAGTTFLDEGDALALYGGSDNVVWGNNFLETSAGGTSPGDIMNGGALTQAINESESGDLVYDNYFSVPVPVVTPTLDPLSCQIECEPSLYADLWNVTPQPEFDYQIVLGQNLTGSIIDTDYQGGNYWSVYGTALAPYGVLPLNESGLIAFGGDYAPLIPFVLLPISFSESGLPAGTAWTVTLLGVTTNETGSVILVYAPPGSYRYEITGPAGYSVTPAGSIDVGLTPLTVAIFFGELGRIAGVVSPVAALLEINGTIVPVSATGAYNDTLAPGVYPVLSAESGYVTNQTSVTVTGGTTSWLNITLTKPTATSSPAPASSDNGIGTTGWYLIAGLALLAAILAVTTALAVRRAKPPSSGLVPSSVTNPPPPPSA